MNPDFEQSDQGKTREILTVSQLNRAVASLLDRSIPPVQVRGEISNFTRAASGHWYFTLKDSGAQVRAVMFRGRAQAVGFEPREGDRVLVGALAGFYQPRGEFQLNVESMRRAGAGDLYQRFVELKEKLRAQGLFDESLKRPVPESPGRVGVISSLQAAALRDVLTTLRRRAPQIPVVIYPSLVQGVDAPSALIAALRVAAVRSECDVLLLVRGGGSIEDLWAFNDEALAREVAGSPIPVVCGVGHETDFTIVDFVADVRAATPTAAAIAAVPDRGRLLERLQGLAHRLLVAQRRSIHVGEQRLDHAARLLRSPSSRWRERSRDLEALVGRLRGANSGRLRTRELSLQGLSKRLRTPDLRARTQALQILQNRLARAVDLQQRHSDDKLQALAHQLELVSPRAVLGRGYAIVRDADGSIVRSSGQVSRGDRLAVQMAIDAIDVEVLGPAASIDSANRSDGSSD